MFAGEQGGPFQLEVDLGAFRGNLPQMSRTASIGQGVRFLNRHLSSCLPNDVSAGGIRGSLYQFLARMHYNGEHTNCVRGRHQGQLAHACWAGQEQLSGCSSGPKESLLSTCRRSYWSLWPLQGSLCTLSPNSPAVWSLLSPPAQALISCDTHQDQSGSASALRQLRKQSSDTRCSQWHVNL